MVNNPSLQNQNKLERRGKTSIAPVGAKSNLNHRIGHNTHKSATAEKKPAKKTLAGL